MLILGAVLFSFARLVQSHASSPPCPVAFHIIALKKVQIQKMLELLVIALWSSYAAGAVITAPTAIITPQPELRKRAVTTAGYYSTGSEDGTTLCELSAMSRVDGISNEIQGGTVTYEAQGSMVATSGSQFLLCASNSCNFGSCSGNSYIMSTTAFYW